MDATALFAEFGRRLEAFGREPRSEAAIVRALEENPWFRRGEIERAVRAIRTEMLAPPVLARWLAHYPARPSVRRRVLVVMAGNLPLVGFADLLCVVASGHRALVSPSSKDRALVSYVMAELKRIDPDVPLVAWSGEAAEAVIATGSGNALRRFRARFAGVPALLRGHRSSVGVLTGHETAEQLAAVADDVLAYSGRGCRNLSLLFLPEGSDTAPLRAALAAWGPVHPSYRNNARQTRALLTMQGLPFLTAGDTVLCMERSLPGRLATLHYTGYRSAEEVSAWLAANDGQVQCVAGWFPHPRRVDFGRTQLPVPDDYADGQDTMRFLGALTGEKW